MDENQENFERNLFEEDNARNLSPKEIAQTFIPTKSFWRLFSNKHHIILGARGSGKTAIVKMLSHDHLSQFIDDKASLIINSKKYIGIYVPTKLEWVGGLKNKPWQSEREKEEFFQWRLNMATCLSFIKTLESCLNTYIQDDGERARIEKKLVGKIAESWFVGENIDTINTIQALKYNLKDIEYKKQQILALSRITNKYNREESFGASFEMDLFTPLKRGIDLTERILQFPDDTIWILCLDEAEFLDSDHHRILNSYLRAHSDNIVFKITTMPYFHYTKDTNTGVPLNVGHDFEYIYLDKDPVKIESHETDVESDEKRRFEFAIELLEKRINLSGGLYREINLFDLLGESVLLDQKRASDWSDSSENMELLRKYCNENTIKRAEELIHNPRKFMNEIGRKIHSALILKHNIDSLKGREIPQIYSGLHMSIRCSDANPRRLIRIFNRLILHAKKSTTGKILETIPRKTQTNLLKAFSTITLNRVYSEPKVGPELLEFLEIIGNFMKNRFYNEPLTTDQIYSIKIDKYASKKEWEIIKHAVSIGLLFPNVSINNQDQLPEIEGIFRLAYVLAPHFNLLPRRGRSINISSITTKWRQNTLPYNTA